MTARTLSENKTKRKAADAVKAAVVTGPAAAALIAGGMGAFIIGLMTTLAEASEGLKNALNWVKPVGPLSGKTAVGIFAWLIAWLILNSILKDKDSDLVRAFTLMIALIVAGLLLTFPPFFELFAAE